MLESHLHKRGIYNILYMTFNVNTRYTLFSCHELATTALTRATKRVMPPYRVLTFKNYRCVSQVSLTAGDEAFPRPPVFKLTD